MDPDPDPLVRGRYGSGDPDPHQNVMDPKHWKKLEVTSKSKWFQSFSLWCKKIIGSVDLDRNPEPDPGRASPKKGQKISLKLTQLLEGMRLL